MDDLLKLEGIATILVLLIALQVIRLLVYRRRNALETYRRLLFQFGVLWLVAAVALGALWILTVMRNNSK